jgi:putative ABC transport system substrate-binding protein
MRLSKEVRAGSVSRRRMLFWSLAAWAPGLPAWAQGRPAGQAVGFLDDAEAVREQVKLLGELGYVEGRNLRVEAVAPPPLRQLPEAALTVVQRQPDVLVAAGSGAIVLASFTETIPIVCRGVPDPVGAGLAKSLGRPGRNVTGLATATPDTASVVFAALKQVRPKVRRVALLHAEGTPAEVAHGEAAKAAGLEWSLVPVGSIDDAERVLPALAGQAVWIAPIGGPRLWRPVLAIAHKHRIATIGAYPGTLMWYSREFTDAPRRVAAIIDKILKGAKPGEIPFEVPDRPRFTLNRTAAQAIGVELPPDLVLRATEVVD